MPAPSETAKRLAMDLKEVGSIYGYISNIEHPPIKGSALKIDVAWELSIEQEHNVHSHSPLPFKMIIVTIEIQYSNAPHSITQGVSKAKLANSPYHIIISYEKLSIDQKEMWMSQFPKGKGLKIIEGNKEVGNLQLWVSYILNNHKDFIEKGKGVIERIKSNFKYNTDMNEVIRDSMDEDMELIFSSKINSYLKFFDDYLDRDTPGNLLNSSILFIQDFIKSNDYLISLSVPSTVLFSDPVINDLPGKWSEGIINILSNSMSLVLGVNSYTLKMSGRNVYHTGYITKISETIETEKIKSFVISAMEELKQRITKFNVTEKENQEFREILKVLNEKIDNLKVTKIE